jgi:hypothetical protein
MVHPLAVVVLRVESPLQSEHPQQTQGIAGVLGVVALRTKH